MPEKIYHISEVEKMLGIPRSTIRFYIKKGLLDVGREKESGYYYYTKQDLRKISHLLVGRNHLALNLKEARSRMGMTSFEDYRKAIYQQEKYLYDQLGKTRRAIEVLHIYERMFLRIKEHLGRCSVKEVDGGYLLPESYIYHSQTSIIDIGYPSAVFQEEDGEVICSAVGSLVHQEDLYLTEKEDLRYAAPCLAHRKCVYTVVKSKEEMESPSLLLSAFTWANDRGLAVEAPYYASYLSELTEGEEKQYYYEVYLPLSDDETVENV